MHMLISAKTMPATLQPQHTSAFGKCMGLAPTLIVGGILPKLDEFCSLNDTKIICCSILNVEMM